MNITLHCQEFKLTAEGIYIKNEETFKLFGYNVKSVS